MIKMSSRDMLVRAVLEIAETVPADKITVRQIVKKSGLSTQSFYNNFSDKNELLQWVSHSNAAENLSRLGLGGYSYYDFTRDNLVYMLEHRVFMRNVITNTYGTESYKDKISEYACVAIRDNILSRHEMDGFPKPLSFYLKMYIYASTQMYITQIFADEPMPPEIFAYHLTESMPEKLKPYLMCS